MIRFCFACFCDGAILQDFLALRIFWHAVFFALQMPPGSTVSGVETTSSVVALTITIVIAKIT